MVPWASLVNGAIVKPWHESCESARLAHGLQKPSVPQSGSLDEMQSDFALVGNVTAWPVNCVQESYMSSSSAKSLLLVIVAASFHSMSTVGGRGMGGAGGDGGDTMASSLQLSQTGQAGQRGWPVGHQPCANRGGDDNGGEGGEGLWHGRSSTPHTFPIAWSAQQSTPRWQVPAPQ
eukprot:scaffold45531_cov63-Phaeocystis_antarctica.AAC.2